MKIVDYLKDKIIFLISNLVIYTIFAVFMYLFNINIICIGAIFFVWFVPVFSNILMDGFKYKGYYGEMQELINSIDNKYMLPEVIRRPDFIEGKIMYDILKDISKDMNDNIKYYSKKQVEYREYIERWIHEIKTPISSTRLVIENNESEITEKIDYEIDKIENYVEQVLYYSRSNDISKDYIVKKVIISDIVKKVLKRNYKDFIKKSITVKIEEIGEIVYSDSKWIEFVINQIVVNSLKYSSDSKGSYIRFYTKVYKNLVELIIEDNGVGIIDRDIDRVFEKGFTGENGRKFGESAGIGLYLCKKMCTKLGININIKSKLNKGTKVYLGFPINRSLDDIMK